MTITAPPLAAAPATATARKRPDGSWRLDDDDWGTFTGPTLSAAYAAAAAYRAGQGDTAVLVTRLLRPGSPADWQVLDRLGCLDDAPVPAEVTITDHAICSRCECPLPAGAPAWPDGDGGVLCNDCTEGEQ